MKGNKQDESKHAWNAVMLSMNSCMASSPSSILAALRSFPWPSSMNCEVSIRWCYFKFDSVEDYHCPCKSTVRSLGSFGGPLGGFYPESLGQVWNFAPWSLCLNSLLLSRKHHQMFLFSVCPSLHERAEVPRHHRRLHKVPTVFLSLRRFSSQGNPHSIRLLSTETPG